MIPMASVLHRQDLETGDFHKSTAFKSYGAKSQYANEYILPHLDIARFYAIRRNEHQLCIGFSRL